MTWAPWRKSSLTICALRDQVKELKVRIGENEALKMLLEKQIG